MKYKLIVFDWDGTLYDSSAFIVNCVQAAAKDAALPIPAADNIKQMIGLSSQEALKRLAPDLALDQIKALQKIFYRHMASCKVNQPTLFNGAVETLHDLTDQGYWLAIATGKGRQGLDYDLKTLQLNELFLATRSADETQSKPHPQMLLEILDELGICSSDALVVGDTEYDMQMASNANVDALAVSYGVHSLEQLQATDAKGHLGDIKDLLGWLTNYK